MAGHFSQHQIGLLSSAIHGNGSKQRDFCIAIPKKCYMLKKCINRFIRKVVLNFAACHRGNFNPMMIVAF